jgi:hypothetical protein
MLPLLFFAAGVRIVAQQMVNVGVFKINGIS